MRNAHHTLGWDLCPMNLVDGRKRWKDWQVEDQIELIEQGLGGRPCALHWIFEPGDHTDPRSEAALYFKDIGALIGKSKTLVQYIYERAMRKLRATLSDKEIEDLLETHESVNNMDYYHGAGRQLYRGQL